MSQTVNLRVFTAPWSELEKLQARWASGAETSPVAPVGRNLPVSAGDVRDLSAIPGSGRSPEGGHGHPLQYSCLENSTDRGACWAMVHSVHKELGMTEVT